MKAETTTPDGLQPQSQNSNTDTVARAPGGSEARTVGAERARERLGQVDHNHAAFVADEGAMLERAYRDAAQAWLEDHYGRPVSFEADDRWRSPVRGVKCDYRAREYTDDQGRPRLHVVIHDHKTGENVVFEDYDDVFEPAYRTWLERRRALTADERATWTARRAEREQQAARAAQARAERAAQAQIVSEDEQQRLDANVAADREFWGELPERGRAAYLVRKQLPHVGPFRYQGQTLVMPLWSATGEFRGVQRVTGRGIKMFTEGARKQSAFTVLGGAPELEGKLDLRDLPRFIAEGVATAVRPYQAYNEPVIVAYDAKNILEALRAICSALDAAGMQKQKQTWLRCLTILADNDQWKTEQLHNGVPLGNVGLEAAHAAAFEIARFDVHIAYPDFTGLSVRDDPTDFDDLAQLAGAGLDAVRAQIEKRTLADPNLVFAQRRRIYLRDHAARGGTFSPKVDLSKLQYGLNIVESPQSTEKTRGLIRLAEQCRAEGLLFIYVSPRISLAVAASNTLGLELYSDYNRNDLSLMSGLSITLNSLHHLEDAAGNINAPYVLALDESDQSIPTLTGTHMTHKTANMRALSRLVARAQYVVCLDADAGETTNWALSTWRGGEPVNRIKNHWDVGAGKIAYVHPHRGQVYEQLGAGTYAGTDSLAESRRVALTLRAQGVKTQLVNGETSHDAENLRFVGDIDHHALTVEAIVASPSISTGVSLTVPNYPNVAGIFYGNNGPASEALQTVWRDRPATRWDLWMQPSGHGGEYIDLEARYGAALDAELARAGNPGHLARGSNDYGYGELKKLVAARNQRARQTFNDDFIWLMVRQGVDVRLVERPTEGEAPALGDLLNEARERERAAYAEERDTAERYDRSTAEALRERGTLTSRERYGLERHDHTSYFHNTDEVNLRTWLLVDYRGRYRAQMERLERVLTDDETVCAYAAQLLDRVEMREDSPIILLRREFGQRLLAAIDFERATATIYAALSPDELTEAAQYELETRANGTSDSPPPIAQRLRAVAVERFGRYSLESKLVRELLEWIEVNRPLLAGVVALPTPDELRANAVRYIRSWLKPLGLRHSRVGKAARGEYALDAGSLALAASVFTRRDRGTLFLKPTSIEKVFPGGSAVPDSTSPPGLEAPDGYETLRYALADGHLQDDRNAVALLEHYQLADAGDETARADLMHYLNDPAVQMQLHQAPPPAPSAAPPAQVRS